MTQTTKLKSIKLHDSDYELLLSIFNNSVRKIKRGAANFPPEVIDGVLRIVEALEEAESVEVITDSLPETKVGLPPPNLCETHPNYAAKRAPRTECKGCWIAYKKMNPNSYELKRRAFLRKKKATK